MDARYVTSADGTRIGFDRLGAGPTIVLVNGLLCTRRTTAPLAEQLAPTFTVINYDRRGRGDSGDIVPYAVEREVEDLAALIADAGGTASLYGHSSGAGLALVAAASGLPIERLVLHEPPYGADDEESRRGARELAEQILATLAERRAADAIATFFAASGLPDEMVIALSSDPDRIAVAHTMAYDIAVMGELNGGAIPEDLVRAITVPTLVLAGGASPEFFRDTAARLAALLQHGQYAVLDGQDHGASAEAVAPTVAAFLAAHSDRNYLIAGR
jgi:pimeloyl-ACP methyl ester carboxylesterase